MLPTSLWRRSSSSGTPSGTLAGSYPIVSVTGSANTMPSGPKSNAVPGTRVVSVGNPVAGFAVIKTDSSTAPAGNTSSTASSASKIAPPSESVNSPSSTVTDAVPVAEPEVAVMVAVPSAKAVMRPVDETLATVDAEDAQETDAPLSVAPF